MNEDYTRPYRIAVFITPHGFGHAARASSVMSSLYDLNPACEFDIFTRVPSWFFQDSLTAPFSIYDVLTDVGLVQTSALNEDLSATEAQLAGFLPFERPENDWVCNQVLLRHCRFILCDIAPLGIYVAKKTGIPSVLIENFTWDWIYRGYRKGKDFLNRHVPYLENMFSRADFHIQTEPVCRPKSVDLKALPAFRKPRESRPDVRQKLAVPEDYPMVLISMGGVPEQLTFIETLKKNPDIYFVMPGGTDSEHRENNVISIPQNSSFYHPDLVNAADAVVGKAGYSTIAEVYHTGIPFAYVPRPAFPESEILSRFIEAEIPCTMIDPDAFHSGIWIRKIHQLLSKPRVKRNGLNGADQIAAFLFDHLL